MAPHGTHSRADRPFHGPNTVTAVHVGAVVEARRTARAAPWHGLFTFVVDDDVRASARAGAASRSGVDSWRRRRQVQRLWQPPDRECHVLRVPGGLAAAEETLVERMVPYAWAPSSSDGGVREEDGGGWGLLLITDAAWTGRVGSQLMLMSPAPTRAEH